MLFFLVINVKMPTIVGILISMSRKNLGTRSKEIVIAVVMNVVKVSTFSEERDR